VRVLNPSSACGDASAAITVLREAVEIEGLFVALEQLVASRL
jgi:hypothetical protein